MNVPHLTDEQFTDLLSGDRSPEASRHLEQCTICQDELGRVQAALGSFDSVSMEWAEMEVRKRIHTPSRLARRWHAVPVWTTATALLLGAAVLLGVHQQNPRQAAHPEQPATAALSLDEDNQLLLNIDSEVRTQHNSPVSISELGIPARPLIHSTRGGVVE